MPPFPRPDLRPLPALRRALSSGGRWAIAGGVVVLAAAALALSWLSGVALGEPVGVHGLFIAALLGVLLGAPLLWALQRLFVATESRARAALAVHDPLTGAATRADFLAFAEIEWARAARYGHSVALVVVEIDRFRQLGDRFGAVALQDGLRELARQAGQTLRGTDRLARFGEAQLAVLLPHADPTGALDVAERIRERGALLTAGSLGGAARITASLGVAVMRPEQQSLALLVEDAESALQTARQAGGNCVRSAPYRATRQTTRGPSVGDNQAARGDG